MPTECKCWIRPFEPPRGCYNICAGRVLMYAKPEELEEIFGLEASLSHKVFEISSNPNLSKLSDFRPELTDEEYTIIESSLKNISDKGAAWLKKTFQREEAVEMSSA